ncbi:MAG: hypothetical protein KBG80_10110, partial [Breznakibacter sp.]|nr:hypothetical protein [Breznakibacter sp.]
LIINAGGSYRRIIKAPYDKNRMAAMGINCKILKIKGRSHSRAIGSADIVAVDFNPRMLMINGKFSTSTVVVNLVGGGYWRIIKCTTRWESCGSDGN